MSAPKLKNLILLILALVNLFLLVLVIPKRLAVRRQEKQELDSLLAFFAQEGISLDAPIPETVTLHASELTCSREMQEALLCSMLGPDCETLRSGYQTVFTSPDGFAALDAEGFFTAEFTPGRFSGTETGVRELLERMGLGHLTVTQTQSDGMTVCTVPLEPDGLPVFSQPMSFVSEDGTLLRAAGQLPVGPDSPVRTGKAACAEAQSALIAFLGSRDETGWVGSRIFSVRQGYVARSAAAAGLVTLEPVWEIRTDTGTFLVDGLTLNVTAA